MSGDQLPPPAKKRHWKKLLRLIHSYLSLFALLSFLFFGGTGFILNHDDWFGLDQVVKTEDEGEIPAKLCEKPDKLAIVEQLRQDFQIHAPLHEFQVEELDLIVLFRKPGQSADVVINRDDGSLTIQKEISGTLGMLAEIHQGEGAGALGGLAIDATAIMLILTALTGLTIWFTIPLQRKLGFIALAVGSSVFLTFIFS
jgi:uncharacterized protein